MMRRERCKSFCLSAISRLECDISLENRLVRSVGPVLCAPLHVSCALQALRNTKLIFAYASLDERVRHLGYAIKHFAKVLFVCVLTWCGLF